MRMYGVETDFYRDLNKYLSNQENNFGIYNSFINILYYGLSKGYLISNNEFPFYRGGVISKKELKILLENESKKTYFYVSKNFLSFSRNRNEATNFLKNIIQNQNNNNLSHLMSNVEMRHYSGFATEEEVLFLPLSAFRLTCIEKTSAYNKEARIIKLNYVGMLLK